jgi:hypothetical protein
VAVTRTVVATRTAAATRTVAPTRTTVATPTHTPKPKSCADVTGDGRVTWRDVDKIARAIARHSRDRRYDVDGNGRVGSHDLALALRQLGRRCQR